MLTLSACGVFADDHDNNVHEGGNVRDVVPAPVASDGDVAGADTDLVLNLDVSPDPGQPGLALREGDQVQVTLPDACEKRRELLLVNVFDCIKQYPRCDTVGPSSRIEAPVTGIPAGRLRVIFRAGSETGTYRVRFALNGGNAVRQIVAVK